MYMCVIVIVIVLYIHVYCYVLVWTHDLKLIPCNIDFGSGRQCCGARGLQIILVMVVKPARSMNLGVDRKNV